MNKQDVTAMMQNAMGDLIKIHSAILDTETGVVDVLATPVKPLEYININVMVKNDE